MTKTQNWDFLNYLYFIGPKYISYTFNKIKKNKNISEQIDYPKYCYLSKKKIYIKNIFKYLNILFYDCINEIILNYSFNLYLIIKQNITFSHN